MQALGLSWDEYASPHPLEEVCTILPEPTLPESRVLFNQWRKHNADGGFIVGRHVPSRDLAAVMSGLCIYEPLNGGMDYRLRLAGTALRRRFGIDPTGKRLSELFEDVQFEYHRAQMSRVAG